MCIRDRSYDPLSNEIARRGEGVERGWLISTVVACLLDDAGYHPSLEHRVRRGNWQRGNLGGGGEV